MMTLTIIIPAIDQGDWLSAFDLQDAYFHITIHPPHRRFLRFTVGHYQYRVLPFGLSMDSRVFSKTLAVVAAYLHRQGVIIFPYLAFMRELPMSFQETKDMIETTTNLLLHLGFHINYEKSTVHPTQAQEFIGATLILSQPKRLYPHTDLTPYATS